MERLDASLRLVLDTTPAALLDEQAARSMSHLAGRLAPIHCAGFEVRLVAGAGAVDLIQRLSVLRGEPARQARFIAGGSLAADEHWQRVRRFCHLWSQPRSVLHRMVIATFLGFDAAVAGMAAPTPSLYLSLEPGAGADIGRLAELVETASGVLRGTPYSPATMATLASCHAALPRGAAITDIGIMLGRDVDAVRVVVAHLRREEVPGYLDRVPWSGAPPRLAEALPLVPASLHHVLLSFDAGPALLPRVGLEYYPGYRTTDLPAWSEALDALVAGGLCATGKRAALLDWPGHLEPRRDGQPWPASLLTESLLNRSDRFLVLARRLTFLKIVCRSDGPHHAKAYFGYGPRSFETDPGNGTTMAAAAASPGVRAARREPPYPGAGSVHRDLDAPVTAPQYTAAIAGGVGYLEGQRRGDRLWREFPRILAGSDEWVSAYIGEALASLGNHPRARATAISIWQTLCRSRGAADGWGYNTALPADADSTLWGLRLARALDRHHQGRALAARRVLERHRLAGGGLATYAPGAEAGLRRIVGDVPLEGLLAMHVCVTAAAAVILDDEVATVIEAQEPDGRWRGYWWSDDEYTTWLAVDALRRCAGREAAQALRRARRWTLTRFDRNRVVWSRGLAEPSVFATALGVAILDATTPSVATAAPLDEPAHSAVCWLLDAQAEDGGWGPAALMRMPPTDALDGDERPEATAVSLDDHRLFTSATVVRVLGGLHRRLAGGDSDQEAL